MYITSPSSFACFQIGKNNTRFANYSQSACESFDYNPIFQFTNSPISIVILQNQHGLEAVG